MNMQKKIYFHKVRTLL